MRLVAGVLLACLACMAQAEERVLYKSHLPDGSLVYSDAPVPGARSQSMAVEPHPTDAKAARAAQAEAARHREQLLRSFEARAARVGRLDQEIPAAARAAERARELAQQAAVMREGDRQGRRVRAEYFERQQVFQAAQAQAEQRLKLLTAERAALAP